MKNIFYIITLLICSATVAQNTVYVYNLNVIRGHAADVVKTFSDFAGGEKWKTGGVMLQSVGFKKWMMLPIESLFGEIQRIGE